MSDFVKDISTLMSAKKNQLEKMVDIEQDAICHKIFESINNGETVAEYDAGIGIIFIQNEKNVLRYKFVPAPSLEKKIVETYNTNEDPLVKRVEEALENRIFETYKDLM